MTAKSVNVLNQRHVHFQAPLPTGFLGVTSVYAGAPKKGEQVQIDETER